MLTPGISTGYWKYRGQDLSYQPVQIDAEEDRSVNGGEETEDGHAEPKLANLLDETGSKIWISMRCTIVYQQHQAETSRQAQVSIITLSAVPLDYIIQACKKRQKLLKPVIKPGNETWRKKASDWLKDEQ